MDDLKGGPSFEENPDLGKPDLKEEPNIEEREYLKLVEKIISNGELRSDRTGTGTFSLFGPGIMRFSLKNNSFPLLTTKKMFLRPIFEELLWFIRGKTDSNILKSKDVHIWDRNGSREFLDSVGLTSNREGDLGPVYGFQWRHFGAEYKGISDYTNKGYDQLEAVIEQLKTDPESRRIIMCAWNPADLSKMALPPCHVLSQFYVSKESGKQFLSCQLYQRSCDMGLGVPFNIASYSLLTILIANAVGMQPKEFVHCLGDAHVYANHIIPLKEQLARTPYEFPKLYVNKTPKSALSAKECINFIENMEFSDIKLSSYVSHGKIKMEMSA